MTALCQLRRAAVAFVVLAGCTPSAPASTPTATRTAAPAPKVAATKTTLRVGTTGMYPPLSIGPVESGPKGFVPELAIAFATDTKREIAWVPFTWPALSAELTGGSFAIAADGITVRADRSIAGRFTVPFARGGAVLLVHAKDRPKAADPKAAIAALDQPGFHVVVNRGGHLEHVARELFKIAQVDALAVNAEVGATLARGGADGAMTNTFEAQEWLPNIADGEMIGPLTNDVTALWLRADQGALEIELDDFLLAREESGDLAKSRAQWLKSGAGPKAAAPVSALFAATAERLALMPFVAAAKAQTKQAVEDPAQEKRVLTASADAVTKAAAERHLAPPRRDLVDAFFRAQIDAAKNVQEHIKPPALEGKSYSLDSDLRPAIARISARLARVLVRLPHGLSHDDILAEAKRDLADTGLDTAFVEKLADAVVALGNAN